MSEKKVDELRDKVIKNSFYISIIFMAVVLIVLGIYASISYFMHTSLFQTREEIEMNAIKKEMRLHQNHINSENPTEQIVERTKYKSKKSFQTKNAKFLKQKSGFRMDLPENSVKLSEHMYYLGKRDFKHMKGLKGFAIFHDVNSTKIKNINISIPEEGEEKRKRAVTSNGSPCVEPIAEGARWKGVSEKFHIDYFNPAGFSMQFIEDTIKNAMNVWQQQLEYDLFGVNDPNNLADGPDSNGPDGKNEIQWGFIPNEGVLAVTFVWGTFSQNTAENVIIEADILFNEDVKWGTLNRPGTYIWYDILVHELGHWIGLADSYDDNCADTTMYFKASKQESKKSSLDQSDINALHLLYGENGPSSPQTNTDDSSTFNPFTSQSSPRIQNSILLQLFSFLMITIIINLILM